MKKTEKVEIPLVNIERNPLMLLLWVVCNAGIAYLTYHFFKNMNPWGFIIMIPAVIMSFLTLWLLLNPFAIFFEDKLEFKQSFFNNSTLYFIDVKQVMEVKNNRLKIIYNDDDMDAFIIYGIKSSHKELLKKHLETFVTESIEKRKN
ncbi:MAG: hypothetical protein H0W61_02070 [Bacteroidetes bacterium]|nr:hypothetical protein [Bacteroidota bacterium]